MNKRKKQAIFILAISTPFFGYGIRAFELGGTSNQNLAMVIAISLTLGGAGTIAGVIMLLTKNRLGWFDSKPLSLHKPIFIKKEENMVKIKKQKPVVITGSASQSIGLMQREKELINRAEELNGLLKESTTELEKVRSDIKARGWILSENGWVIG